MQSNVLTVIQPPRFWTAAELAAMSAEADGHSVTLNGSNIRVGRGARIAQTAQIGDFVTLGEDCEVGPYAVLADGVEIGARTKIELLATVGANSKIGPDAEIGHRAAIGEGVVIGSNAIVAPEMTSDRLNRIAIGMYKAAAKSHKFMLWVTEDRRHPEEAHKEWEPFNAWDPESGRIEYSKGLILTGDGEISDRSYGCGIEVVRIGVPPEFGDDDGIVDRYGADCLMPLIVSVKSDDILYAGMPGNMDALRVRRLKILT